jgi:hypothetical protein
VVVVVVVVEVVVASAGGIEVVVALVWRASTVWTIASPDREVDPRAVRPPPEVLSAQAAPMRRITTRATVFRG